MSAEYTIVDGELQGADIDIAELDFEYAESETILPEGNYSHNNDDDTEGTFFMDGYVSFDTVNDAGDIEFTSTGGSATVARSGDVYTVEYTVNSQVGTIVGYYNGAVTRTVID